MPEYRVEVIGERAQFTFIEAKETTMKIRAFLKQIGAFWLGILCYCGLPIHAASAPAVLLGWNNLGMHCMDSSYAEFSILPPYNTIEAQLIVGGKLVTAGGGYTMTYEAVADPDGSINSFSVGKGNWADFAPVIFGVAVPYSADQGLAGWNMPGLLNTPQPLHFEANNVPAAGASALVNWFRAEGIPITPYDDAGHKNPYPLMRLVARDAANKVVAQSDIVLPVSDEMDCRVCHGANTQSAAMPAGGWTLDANKDREQRLNILRVHDDREFANHQDLYVEALAAKGFAPAGLYATTMSGKPMLCAACHASEALGAPSFTSAKGLGTVPPLTASMHSKHADVADPVLNLTLNHSDNRASCYRCHPGSATRCLRGAMGSAVAADGSMAMQCQSCHGTMSQVGSSQRVGWFMEPNCQSCHTGPANHNNGQIRYQSVFDGTGKERVPVDPLFATTPNTPAAGISLYRFSSGHGGLQCSACHGSTHAEFPAAHRNDNIRNVQMQGHAGVTVECVACHTTMPTSANGGPHGLHPIGQAWVNDHHDAISQVGLASCQACHGTDNRGTVLSRVQADRSFRAGDSGTQAFYRGATVGCYTCHQGPSSSSMNTDLPPAIADVSATTVAGVPVDMVLPVGNATAVLRILSQPANGSVGLSNNVATYFPAESFTGTETFTFAAYDGARNSRVATGTVTVGPNSGGWLAPQISGDPVSQTVIAGGGATFSVVASGGTLTYQWSKEGWPISGAVDAVLNLPAVSPADAGSYRALVRNQGGATASAAATLTVLIPVTVTTQPVSQTVLAGTTVQFNVPATGSTPLTFQWSKNGAPINGATGNFLRLSNVSLNAAGEYRVRVTNPAGGVDSDVAVLIVQAPPTISRQPVSQTVIQGTTVTLSVTATAFPVPTYQWYKDSIAIPGATATAVTFPSVALADAGAFMVVVSNPLGTANSSTATLTVKPPTPVITGFSPGSGTVGSLVTLTGSGFAGATAVKFNGVSAASYIVGSATQITVTVPAGATTGRITVTTPGGTATSGSNFTVYPVPTISSFSPGAGSVGSRVTLYGSGFSAGAAVTFKGIAASSVSWLSATQLSAIVPSAATTGPIQVTTPGGSAVSGVFRVTPNISGFTPGSGRVGTAVTVTGTGFTGATAVAFNGKAAAFTVISPTTLITGVPVGATLGRITVTTPGGTATSGSNFAPSALLVAPVITTRSPSSGPAGTKVTVNGANVGAATAVKVGAVSASFTVISANQIQVTVLNSGAISVTTPGGVATSVGAFTVL